MRIIDEIEKWMSEPGELNKEELLKFAELLDEKYELVKKDGMHHVQAKSCCVRNPCGCVCHVKPEVEKKEYCEE